MAKSAIYVPQTDMIYPSISSAAAALGVDPSNIGKVLRGKRTSAGGYNFNRVSTDISSDSLKFIKEATEQSLSEKQKSRQKKRRAETRAKKAARDRQRGQAARQLQKTLKEANKIIQEYKDRKLDAVSSVIPELENLKAVVGKTKAGTFNAGFKNLAKFNQKQLEALQQAVSKQLNRKGFKNLDEAERKKQALAYQISIQPEEVDKYNDALTVLWQILDLQESVQGKGYDTSLYDNTVLAVNGRVDPEELKVILDEILNIYQKMDEGTYEAKYGDDAQKYFDAGIKEMVEMVEELIEVRGEEPDPGDYWNDDDDDFIHLGE